VCSTAVILAGAVPAAGGSTLAVAASAVEAGTEGQSAAGENTDAAVQDADGKNTETAEQGADSVVLADGIYSAEFDTDSSMFHVNESQDGRGILTVKDGQMTIHVSLTSKNIVNLFVGSAEDAQKEGAELLEPTVDSVTYSDGYTEEVYGFDIPVLAIDEPFAVALIGKKGKWYDHTVSVSDPQKLEAAATGDAADDPDAASEEAGEESAGGADAASEEAEEKTADGADAGKQDTGSTDNEAGPEQEKEDDSLLSDGNYQVEVSLNGGSGKATIESPMQISVEDGAVTATVVWSSPYYDYMIVDGEKYEPVNAEGNSMFEIPVVLEEEMTVTADTVAMSTPHEIEYTFHFDLETLEPAGGSEAAPEEAFFTDTENTDINADAISEETAAEIQEEKADDRSGETWCGLTYDHSMELQYAQQFRVDYYEGDYTRILIGEGDCYLLVPEGGEVPDELEDGVIVLQKPVQNIYLVATSAMDLFCSLDALDTIRLSGTNADGWYVEAAKEAMEAGDIVYAGKYSTPDYERILAEGCGLAIESTMIYHNPEVKEKLETFGIPVLVERSSYENHPMGRTEWIRLYGALLGKEEQADALFEEQAARVREVESAERSDKTVAFFYITSNGYANVRRSGDYISNMIDLAGGTYIFGDLGDDGSGTSTVNMTMEEFYAQAKDADYIIYNSTIDGEIQTIEELLAKSALLSDFRAVKEGSVWCTGKNLFQETTGLADMIVDIHTILTDAQTEDDALTYLHRVTAD
jgi:iron complex transport system substrate-binding protein